MRTGKGRKRGNLKVTEMSPNVDSIQLEGVYPIWKNWHHQRLFIYKYMRDILIGEDMFGRFCRVNNHNLRGCK